MAPEIPSSASGLGMVPRCCEDPEFLLLPRLLAWPSSLRPASSGLGCARWYDRHRTSRTSDIAIPARQHAAGAKTSISLTMTAEKYTLRTPQITRKSDPSVSGLKQETIPLAIRMIANLRSFTKLDQDGAWCSDTDAMMGMYLLA